MSPDPIDAHCLVCHAARLQDRRHAEGVLARALSVEASKVYAVLHYRALLNDASQ